MWTVAKSRQQKGIQSSSSRDRGCHFRLPCAAPHCSLRCSLDTLGCSLAAPLLRLRTSFVLPSKRPYSLFHPGTATSHSKFGVYLIYIYICLWESKANRQISSVYQRDWLWWWVQFLNGSKNDYICRISSAYDISRSTSTSKEVTGVILLASRSYTAMADSCGSRRRKVCRETGGFERNGVGSSTWSCLFCFFGRRNWSNMLGW